MDARRRINSYERLKNIKVPTLILHGKKDVEISLENVAILAKAIPHAKLITSKSQHIVLWKIKQN